MASMDTLIRRIVITEDEDLDLDKLLLVDNSRTTPSSPPSPPPRPSLPSLHSPSSPLANDTAVPPVAAQCIVTEECPKSPILAKEEDDDDIGGEREGSYHWVLPPPAQPGDFLSGSLHKVPSKSILKKTSSYGNFDSSQSSSKGGSGLLPFTMDSSSKSQGKSRQPANMRSPLDSSSPGRFSGSGRVKQHSTLSCNSSNSNHSYGIGWDIDAPSSPNNNPPAFAGLLPLGLSPTVPLPPVPGLKSDGDGCGVNNSQADRAAGMDASGSRHSFNSNSTKIRRNVSFHSVDVREYDRTVGDNPSCRSGPPLSLDWSYSKKYKEKNFEEYELERSSDRVGQVRKLHMNKWKRRNLLSFNWGHTEEEMKEARRGTRRAQRQRSMTRNLLPLLMVEEALIGVKNFMTKKTNGAAVNASDDWSDISNSNSTKDSSRTPRCSGVGLGPSLGQGSAIGGLQSADRAA